MLCSPAGTRRRTRAGPRRLVHRLERRAGATWTSPPAGVAALGRSPRYIVSVPRITTDVSLRGCGASAAGARLVAGSRACGRSRRSLGTWRAARRSCGRVIQSSGSATARDGGLRRAARDAVGQRRAARATHRARPEALHQADQLDDPAVEALDRLPEAAGAAGPPLAPAWPPRSWPCASICGRWSARTARAERARRELAVLSAILRGRRRPSAGPAARASDAASSQAPSGPAGSPPGRMRVRQRWLTTASFTCVSRSELPDGSRKPQSMP